MKFKIPYLSRLLEIKEEQLQIEKGNNQTNFQIQILLIQILDEIKKLNKKKHGKNKQT